MRKNWNKKGIRMLMALMVAVSVLFGVIGNIQPVSAATKGDYYIKINKGTNVVTVYKNDGTPYTAFACSTGYATPTGTFHTMAKYRWWELDGPSFGQYCTRITGSILFHSVWYYQNRTPNSQSYRQYNRLGTTASHGCCRLTVAASKWIYDNCPVGTKVIIFSGKSKDDPLGKPETIEVKGYSGWDPTDPDPANPYKTKSTKPVIKVSKKTLAYGSKFGDGNMSCKDSGGFDITKWVKKDGKVNMKKVGTYLVTYSVIDSFGRTATKKVKYHVVDNKTATLTGVKESIIKQRGNTRNMLVGLKAKDAAGVDLTDEIEIYIKAPSGDEYVKCEGTRYTFNETGTYQVKYTVKNPNNGKKTTKKQTIMVTDSKAPILTCKNDWAEIRLKNSNNELYWDDLMEGVTAFLPSGTDITDTIEIKITAPSGELVTLLESQSYTFTECGSYTLVYKATNSSAGDAALSTEHVRYLTVVNETQAEVVIDE